MIDIKHMDVGAGGVPREHEGVDRGASPSGVARRDNPRGYTPYPNATVSLARGQKLDTPAPKNFFPKKIDHLLALSRGDQLPALHNAPQIFMESAPIDPDAIAYDMIRYFSRPSEGWFVETKVLRDGTVVEDRKPYKQKIPMITEFANAYGMTEKELLKLSMTNKKLSRAVEFARDVMKTDLMRGGLIGDYVPSIVQFMATNETSMRVKSEHTEKRVNINELLDQLETNETNDNDLRYARAIDADADADADA